MEVGWWDKGIGALDQELESFCFFLLGLHRAVAVMYSLLLFPRMGGAFCGYLRKAISVVSLRQRDGRPPGRCVA